MLIRFVVSNYLSIGEMVEFNMLTGPYKTHINHVASSRKIKLLKAAAIYGANGAGKSSLIKALETLRDILVEDERVPASTKSLTYRLSDKYDKEPIVFDIEFSHKKKYFGYTLKFKDGIILEESLYELGFAKEDKLIFERTYSSRLSKSAIQIGDKYNKSEKNKLLIKLLEDNLLLNDKPLLCMYKVLKIANITAAATWFQNNLKIIFPESKFGGLVYALSSVEHFKPLANKMLNSFDTGVCEIGVEDVDFDDYFGKENNKIKVELLNRLNKGIEQVVIPGPNGGLLATLVDGKAVIKQPCTYHYNDENRKIHFDITEESDGTQRLLDIIPAIDMLLNGEVTIIIDEIDRSIHPKLLKDVIAKLLSSETDLRGQIIFTTHECNLLDFNLFRQDEIWFVEKHQGNTVLYPLTDFRPRQDLDIAKGYLKGRFGAIPFLGNLSDLNWNSNATSEKRV